MSKNDTSVKEENKRLRNIVNFQQDIIEALTKRKSKYEKIIISKSISLQRGIDKKKDNEIFKMQDEEELER